MLITMMATQVKTMKTNMIMITANRERQEVT